MARTVVVTGGNRGIGRAMVGAIVDFAPDIRVWLGARDPASGEHARALLEADNGDRVGRIHVLELDVSSDSSVSAAAARVAGELGDLPLYGLVNNAGIHGERSNIRQVVDVNLRGTERTCRSFMDLLQVPGGRVVNIASASGPVFVAQCAQARQRLMTNPLVDWAEASEVLDQVIALAESGGDLAAAGWGEGGAYGLSKAFVNTLTLFLARRNPELMINACTPGFIETDMTRPWAVQSGRTPAEMGMKPPAAGTVSALHLLFSERCGSGHYFGSDALRSPLDRYRAPGAPEYTGP